MSCIKYVCFTLKHQLIVVVIGSNVIWCPSYLYLSSSPSQPFFLQMSPCTKKYHREGVVSVVLAIGWTRSKVKTIKSTRTIAIHTHTRMWKTTRNQLWLDLYLHRMRRTYIYLLEKSNGFETRIDYYTVHTTLRKKDERTCSHVSVCAVRLCVHSFVTSHLAISHISIVHTCSWEISHIS